MAYTITMPQLGETVSEGTILAWVKSVGDTVAVDDIVVEISTDKVDTELPSPVAGVLIEILVEVGTTVDVGTALAVLDSDDEAIEPEDASEPVESLPVTDDAQPPEADPSQPQAPLGVLSPVVRKLARDKDVDLASVVGTGSNGRITRIDVETFISARDGAGSGSSAALVASAAPQPGDVREIPRLRSLIAANMIQNKQTAAHVWTSVEVDYQRIADVRSRHGEAFKATHGHSLTYLPFVARATVDALAAYPVVNSLFDLDAGTHTFHNGVNLGIAVDLDQGGLVVANVRGADSMTLRAVAGSIRRVAAEARSGTLGPDGMTGYTFSISNPGPYGSFMTAPIIPVPNSAILSTDTVVKRPVAVELPDGSDGIAIHHIGYLGLTWDHRVFDGSTAVLFLKRIKENLETWEWEQELT